MGAAVRIATAAFACFLAACALVDADAVTKRPKSSPKRVTGTVRLVGSEPLTRVVVTAFRDGVPSDCLVEGPLGQTLRNLHQGQVIAVEGNRCRTVPTGFADCIVATKILPAD
jgi:hypothetical protein